MTKELYERLKPYELHLRKAYYEKYMRGCTSGQLADLNDIYTKIFGDGSQLLSGCSRCILQSLERLGKVYFETPYKEETIKTKTTRKNGKTKERPE